jgi:Mn-dependent DtxR family transcriptional regulator
VRKNYFDLIATSRVRPKIVIYFGVNDEPINVTKLAQVIEEDASLVSVLLQEFTRKGFLQKTEDGYVLKQTNIKDELISIAKKTFS